MNKGIFTAVAITSVLLCSPITHAEDDDRGEYRGGGMMMNNDDMRHPPVHIDLMKMLADTMEILRDLNHKPTDKEKAHLNDMINQLHDMMKNRAERRDDRREERMENRDRRYNDDDRRNDKW